VHGIVGCLVERGMGCEVLGSEEWFSFLFFFFILQLHLLSLFDNFLDPFLYVFFSYKLHLLSLVDNFLELFFFLFFFNSVYFWNRFSSPLSWLRPLFLFFLLLLPQSYDGRRGCLSTKARGKGKKDGKEYGLSALVVSRFRRLVSLVPPVSNKNHCIAMRYERLPIIISLYCLGSISPIRSRCYFSIYLGVIPVPLLAIFVVVVVTECFLSVSRVVAVPLVGGFVVVITTLYF
jgi:hypothetical protein